VTEMDFAKLLTALDAVTRAIGASVPALPLAIEAGKAIVDLAKSARGGLPANDQATLDAYIGDLVAAMDSDVDAAVKALRGG